MIPIRKSIFQSSILLLTSDTRSTFEVKHTCYALFVIVPLALIVFQRWPTVQDLATATLEVITKAVPETEGILEMS